MSERRTGGAMKILVVAAVFAAFCAPARAQMGGACMMTELTKLCGAPGSPEFQACAKSKAGEATANCQGASAAAKKDAPGGKNPCGDDIKKYCPGMWPGTPEFQSCMSSHMGDVTPACAEFGRKQMGKHKAMSAADAACVADAKKLCPGLTGTDGPKFMGCMTGHYDELSAPCKKQFKSARGGKNGEPDAVDCMQAMKKTCPEAEPGSPEMTRCMIEHRDELPASCRKKKGK
jgi:hypothetical protein